MKRRAALSALCSLDDPTRALLYDFVAGRGAPVSRDEAAEAVGIDRSTAAYHLDQLVDQGLLTTSFARPPGRGGPGAGRPAKHYEPADTEVAASVPPRDYQLAAELLARAVAADPDAGVRRALEAAARGLGADLAASVGGPDAGLVPALEELGYRPYDDEGVLRLRNCPFHRLAQAHTELICGMNLALLSGVTDGLDDDAVCVLAPGPGRCCVACVPPAGGAAAARPEGGDTASRWTRPRGW